MYWSLNSVRAALGVSVLLYHLSGAIALDKYFGFELFERLFGFGGARVPFFFVLSGFVMTLVYARDFGQPHKAAGYLRRRLLRLFPTYWVVLLLVLATAWLAPGYRDVIPGDPWVLLKTFLLLPQPASVAGATGAPVIVVAWTLHYEIVFYLLLAAWICSRAFGLALAALLAANALACAAGWGGFYNHFLAAPCVLHFAVGAAAALLVERLPPLPNATALAALAFAGYMAIAVLAHERVDISGMVDPNRYFVGLAAIILLCLVNAERARPPARSSKPVQLLSDSSYALYLLHFPLISLCCKLLVALGLQGPLGALLAFMLTTAACIALAIGFHCIVERPLLAWR